MKIGYDYTQPSLSPGGCGWHAHSLLVELAKYAPQDQFLAYRHFGATVIPEEQLAPLPQAANICDAFPGMSQKALKKTWAQVREQHLAPGKPDIVHSLCFQSPRFDDAKLVITVFDLAFWVHPEYSTEPTRLLCENGILDALEHADGLIFSSEHSRAEFERQLPCYRRLGQIPSIVTPLGCRYTPIPKKQAAEQAAREGDYWLFVGSLEPRKNLVGLLDAYEAYAHSHPAPKPLHLAGGSGWRNDEIRAKLASLEERGLVRHLGVVPDAQLPQLYQNATAFIFPTWYEGFGLPILEAMSQGCPVICSDRSSLPEVGGNAALYIDPAAASTIADAMRRIEIEPHLRAQLIQDGLAQAAKFSWKRAAKQTHNFYKQVLAAPFTRDITPTMPTNNSSPVKPRRGRSFWQTWFPSPKKLQKRSDKLEAEQKQLEAEQKQFSSNVISTLGAFEQRLQQLETDSTLKEHRLQQLAADAEARELRLAQHLSEAQQNIAETQAEAAANVARIEQALQERIGQFEQSLAALKVSTHALLPTLEKQLHALSHAPQAAASTEAMQATAAQALATAKSLAALDTDTFYARLEERWRGSREFVRALQEGYLPLVAKARAAVAARALATATTEATASDCPHAELLAHLRTKQGVLDLASGRGEWLQLLKEQGVPAVGVDLNQIFTDECRAQGLDVIGADVLEFLSKAPSDSVAVITGFHIIEHLPFPVLHRFVQESLRVLCPGGIVIFETPNPRNVLVSTLTFRLDPTHLHPINPDFIQYLLEDCGFADVHCQFSGPYPEVFHVGAPDDPLAKRFNELFYGPTDFAVIGTKD